MIYQKSYEICYPIKRPNRFISRRITKPGTAYNQDEEWGQLSRDAEAHRDGWAAVQREFVQDREKGGWYRKGEGYQEEKAEGFIEKIKSLVM